MARNLFQKAMFPRGKAATVNGELHYPLPGFVGAGAPWEQWSHDRAVKEGFKKSHWVYASVRQIAQAAASVPWVAVDNGGEDLPDHPLTKLLARPNEETTGSTFVQELTGYLYLGGNALIPKVRNSRQVKELWALSPEGFKPIPSPDRMHGSVLRYEKGTGKDKVLLRPKDTIHVKFPDPADPTWGMAPLMAAAMSVDTDVDAVSWNRSSLRNRAVTDGVLSTDQALSEEQYERLSRQMKDQHQGPSNARKAYLLEAGLSWQQMSLSPAEMDFVESRRITREDILSVFGVPPAVLGIVQSATQSDVEAMLLQFWLNTVIPYLSDLRDSFNLSLASEFGDVKVRFDLSDVPALAPQIRAKIDSAKKLTEMGVPVSEANRLLGVGLMEYEGWDASVPAKPVGPLVPAAVSARVLDAKSLNKSTSGDHWKAFDNRREPYYELVAKRCRAFLAEEAEEVLGSDTPLTVIDERSAKWVEELAGLYSLMIRDFGELEESKAFDFGVGRIASWISKWSKTRGALFSNTTKERIAGIVDKLGRGSEANDAIRVFYADESRIENVATTETVAATNQGSEEGARQSGKRTKTWNSTPDEKRRKSHRDAEGQTVGIDEFFIVGGYEGMQPGDPALPASETNRCRCVASYS